MIGLAFNLVERYLLERHGEAALGAALAGAGFAGADPWLDSMIYPTTDFSRWADAVAHQDGADADELLRRTGRWAMPGLIQRYTVQSGARRDPGQLIAELGSAVLPQLRRVLVGLSGADFGLVRGDDSVELVYRSARLGGALCPAVEGALLGLGEHFGAPLRVRHAQCQRHGDDSCRLQLSLADREPA